MGRKKKEQKGKFDAIPQEYVAQIMSDSVEKIDAEIRKCVGTVIALKIALKEDNHIAELKEELKAAQDLYKDGISAKELAAEFCIEILRARGVKVPELDEFLKKPDVETI